MNEETMREILTHMLELVVKGLDEVAVRKGKMVLVLRRVRLDDGTMDYQLILRDEKRDYTAGFLNEANIQLASRWFLEKAVEHGLVGQIE